MRGCSPTIQLCTSPRHPRVCTCVYVRVRACTCVYVRVRACTRFLSCVCGLLSGSVLHCSAWLLYIYRDGMRLRLGPSCAVWCLCSVLCSVESTESAGFGLAPSLSLFALYIFSGLYLFASTACLCWLAYFGLACFTLSLSLSLSLSLCSCAADGY